MLTGTLVDDQHDVLDQGSYDIDAAATAGANSDGIDVIRVTLDGKEQSGSTTTCHATACTAHALLSIGAGELTDGTHELLVEAFSEEGRLRHRADHVHRRSRRAGATRAWASSPARVDGAELGRPPRERPRRLDGLPPRRRRTDRDRAHDPPIDEPAFVDIAPPTGGHRLHRPRTRRSGNLSSPSAAVTVTGNETPIPGPLGLDATPSSEGVTLSWEPVSMRRASASTDAKSRRRLGASERRNDHAELRRQQRLEDDDLRVRRTSRDATRAAQRHIECRDRDSHRFAGSPPTIVEAGLDDGAQLSEAVTYVQVSVSGAGRPAGRLHRRRSGGKLAAEL